MSEPLDLDAIEGKYSEKVTGLARTETGVVINLEWVQEDIIALIAEVRLLRKAVKIAAEMVEVGSVASPGDGFDLIMDAARDGKYE